jgi:hypothetical protein
MTAAAGEVEMARHAVDKRDVTEDAHPAARA